VSDAELGNQGIDRSDLNPGSATLIPKFGRSYMIFTVRLQQRQRCEPLDNLRNGLRPREPLEQLLKDQPRGDNNFGVRQRLFEHLNLGLGSDCVPTQREGPDARVDKKRHVRERSAL